MGYDSIALDTADSPIDDIAYLSRSTHRVPMLAAMAARPRSRSELWELTGVSSSTVRRTLREFEDRNWIRREGYQYEATEPGAFVASAMEELIERIESERTLRDIWDWFPDEMSGFAIEACSDGVVTVADSDDPYAPVNRFESLLRTTSEFRFVGSDIALLEPCKDVVRQRIVDGMATEIVDPPSAANYILSSYSQHCGAALERDSFTVLVHEELPGYGIGLFDDRIAVSCYEQDSGTVRVLIDTDVPAARTWAESTYERYHRDARPLDFERRIEQMDR